MRPVAKARSVSAIDRVRLLAGSQRAHQRMLAAAVDDFLAAENESALRRADQFVGRAGHGVDAGAISSRIVGRRRETVRREIDDASAPFVVQQRHFFFVRLATSSSIDGDSVKPTISKFERCTRSIAAVFVGIARRNRRRGSDSSFRLREASRRPAG